MALGQDVVVIASAPWVPPLELPDEELLEDELLPLLLLPLDEDEPLPELLEDDELLVDDEPLLVDELVLPELDPEVVVALLVLPPPPQAVTLRQEIDANSSRGVGRMQSLIAFTGLGGKMSRLSD